MRPAHVPDELVIDFDLYDASMGPRIHAIVDDLRQTMPIAWTDHNEGHWIVTRYDDVQRVLRDLDYFSSSPVAIPRSREADEQHRPIPVAYDPPDHTIYRDLMAPLFTPRRMRELEEQITRLVDELIDGFVDQGNCEFVADFAMPLPATVFLMLMGWPLDRAQDFNQWTHKILIGEPGGSIEASAAVRAEHFGKIYDYFDELVAERRKNPQDDFTTHIVNGTFGGERQLRDDEIRRMLSLLMLGGLHTVQASLSYAALHLATDQEKQKSLRDNDGMATHAVEEILRWDPPVWPGRRCRQDVMIGGVLVKEEDMILSVVTAANADEGEFPDPRILDLDRRKNRHLTFGAGIHRCVGSHLARLELRIALEALHRRLPQYRLEPGFEPSRYLGPVNGIHELRLEF